MCLQNLSYISRSVRVYLPVSCPRTPRPSFILVHSLLLPFTIYKEGKQAPRLLWVGVGRGIWGGFQNSSVLQLRVQYLEGLNSPFHVSGFTVHFIRLVRTTAYGLHVTKYSYECCLTQNLEMHCFPCVAHRCRRLLGMKVVDDHVEIGLDNLASENSIHFLSYFLSKLGCFYLLCINFQIT